ncbi:hypothetical protein [Orenia marismortui]|uniref:hypothetical protein n=1 Tax=Orenia marismortui TaxID=46469 RepID=UPI000365CB97|nr:hypothetical protein [Orenia marismortui]
MVRLKFGEIYGVKGTYAKYWGVQGDYHQFVDGEDLYDIHKNKLKEELDNE